MSGAVEQEAHTALSFSGFQVHPILTATIQQNLDGSPTGRVEMEFAIDGAIPGHRVVCSLEEFGSFCGTGLELVRQAEANEDPQ